MLNLLKIYGAVLLGSLVAAGVFEFVLRLMPIQNGLFAADPTNEWPVHHMVTHGRYTFSDGWDLQNIHHGTTNNLGYVAPFDYSSGASAIAVVGNSFIESTMNGYSDTLQGQLAQRVQNAPLIMNFGNSGAGLSDYIGLGGLVANRFRITWVVVLVVAGDFTNGFAASPGYFQWSRDASPPVRLRPEIERGTFTKLVRSLALVRYVRGNLRANLAHLLHSGAVAPTTGHCSPEELKAGDAALIQEYVRDLPAAYAVRATRVILIFDADLNRLYSDGTASQAFTCPTRDALAKRALEDAARLHGEHVVDMSAAFAAYYRATGERVDYTDGHWNAAGHRLAALEVARIINSSSAGMY